VRGPKAPQPLKLVADLLVGAAPPRRVRRRRPRRFATPGCAGGRARRSGGEWTSWLPPEHRRPGFDAGSAPLRRENRRLTRGCLAVGPVTRARVSEANVFRRAARPPGLRRRAHQARIDTPRFVDEMKRRRPGSAIDGAPILLSRRRAPGKTATCTPGFTLEGRRAHLVRSRKRRAGARASGPRDRALTWCCSTWVIGRASTARDRAPLKPAGRATEFLPIILPHAPHPTSRLRRFSAARSRAPDEYLTKPSILDGAGRGAAWPQPASSGRERRSLALRARPATSKLVELQRCPAMRFVR